MNTLQEQKPSKTGKIRSQNLRSIFDLAFRSHKNSIQKYPPFQMGERKCVERNGSNRPPVAWVESSPLRNWVEWTWVDLEKCQVLGRQHIDFDPIPFDPIRPQSIRPKLFDQKGRPNSFRPLSFDPFHAIPFKSIALGSVDVEDVFVESRILIFFFRNREKLVKLMIFLLDLNCSKSIFN